MKHILLSFLLCAAVTSIRAQTLEDALLAKDTSLALELVRKGADLNKRNARGNTLLTEACHFANTSNVKFLLRHGATPDEPRSASERTSLIVACAYWSGLDIIKLLVEAGADVNAADDDGVTPLMMAAMTEKQDVVDYLLTRGATPDAMDVNNRTALHYARNGSAKSPVASYIKNTRIDKEAVIASLEAAAKR